MKEELYDLANHIASAKGGLPLVWQDWANEIEMDIRKLANREAQPVGYIDPDSLKEYRGQRAGGTWSAVQRTTSGLNMTTPIYTAPPAPAVPTLPTALLDAMDEVLRISDRDHEAWDKAKSAITACRAAMLAQPVSGGYTLNSPVIPDGWVACSERMPTPFVDVIASDGKQTICAHVIEDRWWCIVSETAEEPGPIIFWMPLPAAPEGGNDLDTRR